MAGIAWTFFHGDLRVFPGSRFTFFPFTDEHDNAGQGRTRVEEFKILPGSVVMKYTLRLGALYPYVGINIGLKNDFFDIREYDDVRIKIRATESKRLRMFILENIDGITKPGDYSSYVYLYKEIPIWENKEEYILPLRAFYIPQWWYSTNRIEENDPRIKRDLSKIAAILIESDAAFPLDITDTIELEGFRFSRDPLPAILLFAGILSVYGLALLAYALRRAWKNRMIARIRDVVIPYERLDLDKEQDPDLIKVVDFLALNYRTPELSVKDVSAASSVPVYKIPALIKERFRLSFPGYVNSLRLTEAKQLLAESDENITDIAMNVGYNNLSHFNNLFKLIEGISPGEFRKRNRE
jgi:AraC-like DNA-binding protein